MPTNVTISISWMTSCNTSFESILRNIGLYVSALLSSAKPQPLITSIVARSGVGGGQRGVAEIWKIQFPETFRN